MKTVNLKTESPSVGELLAMARKKSVLLVSKDGATFVLEEADEFDREVAELGVSEKFMKFLTRRSRNQTGARCASAACFQRSAVRRQLSGQQTASEPNRKAYA